MELANEKALSDVLLVCAAVVMAIALVGVFAMTSYSSRHRSKEIAIHRALGATFLQALLVLVRPYLRLVVIAVVLFTPAALYMCTSWLAAYPEQISAGWVAGAGLLAATVTIGGTALSSGGQSFGLVRQAVAKSLRTE